ncbi:Increased DNA methylation 2 [Glycine soja]|uniref:Increased DNA methylation 2 n=1 Tax=Glycine soja TaxID=3848 RepID=A0A445KYK6_GLYSO|nr:Increased DNA methylation 2 [Glycine soja]
MVPPGPLALLGFGAGTAASLLFLHHPSGLLHHIPQNLPRRRLCRHQACTVDFGFKVLISGVTTTGENIVSQYSQVFEMQTHNLCPPGQFSISFQLPGPVDPHQFSGNFGTDGILEGIVMKGKCT